MNIRQFHLFLISALLVLGSFFSPNANAFFPRIGFWKNRPAYSLKYTTVAQTIFSSNCSGVVTVKTYNPAGALYNVTSPLTVNLTGDSNTTFYSDSSCSTPISSITISTGSNSGNFYFTISTAGSVSVLASATNYNSANQTEVINANPYIWTGNGGNSSWSTAGNWSGGAAPGGTNTAIFNSVCSTNCSPTITSNISIGGIRVDPGYNGTITQNAGITMALASHWIQRGGAFSGGNLNFTVGGRLYLENTTFTFPQSNFQLNSDVMIKSTATLVTTGSTMILACGYNQVCSINTGTSSLKNVIIQGGYTNYDLVGSTMNISGNLSLGDSWGPSELEKFINNGTINVGGNITVINNGFKGTAQIVATGNPSGQVISGIADRYMPALKIAAGTNPVTITGPINIANGFQVISAGTVTTTGLITVYCQYGITCPLNGGSVTYNDFNLIGYYGNYDLGGTTFKVGGKFSAGDTYGPTYNWLSINNGTIQAYGDVAIINYGYRGTASVVIAGNPSGQTIFGGGNGFSLPNLTISAGTNPVTLSGYISSFPNFTMNSVGTFTTTGSTMSVSCDHSVTCTITPGTAVYNNVTLDGRYSIYNLNGGTMTVQGDLNIGDRFSPGYTTQPINNGTINVSGNINIINNGNTGTATIVATGNPSGQTISSTAVIYMPNLRIASGANNVSLSSTLRVYGNLSLTSGSLNMSANTLNVTSALSLASGTTLTKGGGTLTYGSLSNSGTINP